MFITKLYTIFYYLHYFLLFSKVTYYFVWRNLPTNSNYFTKIYLLFSVTLVITKWTQQFGGEQFGYSILVLLRNLHAGGVASCIPFFHNRGLRFKPPQSIYPKPSTSYQGTNAIKLPTNIPRISLDQIAAIVLLRLFVVLPNLIMRSSWNPLWYEMMLKIAYYNSINF